MLQEFPLPERVYDQAPPGDRTRVRPAALPSAQIIPLFPPVYVYVTVPPEGSVIDLRRPVTFPFVVPGVSSYWNVYFDAFGRVISVMRATVVGPYSEIPEQLKLVCTVLFV